MKCTTKSPDSHIIECNKQEITAIRDSLVIHLDLTVEYLKNPVEGDEDDCNKELKLLEAMLLHFPKELD